MLRYLVLPLRFLRTVAHRWPAITVLVLLVLLPLGTAVGVYAYALHQWQAAELALEQDQAEQAHDRLSLCRWVWPRSTRVYILSARAARLSGHMDEADAYLKECLRLEGGLTEATQLEFLLMRAQTGEEDEVADVLSSYVTNKHPESALILKTLAGAYMHDLRFGLAHTWLSRWIDEVPSAAQAFYWRGWVLDRLSNLDEAMKDYERALERDPDLVPVRLRMAELYLEKSRPADALPHLERLARQFPERPDVLARLGHCRFLQGQPAEARRLLEAARQQLPDDSALLLNLAKLELQEDRPVQAERLLRHALEVDPTDVVAEYTLVNCLQNQGRKQEAAPLLEHCIKQRTALDEANKLLKDEAAHTSRDPEAAARIGAALLRIGRERQAMYWLEQALLRDPAHQAAHQALADYFEKKDQPQKAAAHRRWLTKSVGGGR
jgi:tetratricopeptide (TPR) repeat protein